MSLPLEFLNSITTSNKKGVGVDILQKDRIYKICNTSKKTLRFAEKILSLSELVIFNSLATQNVQINYLAKRFCGKEAISKAFGTGIGSKIGFKDLSILNYANGSPFVQISQNVADLFAVNYKQILISISDEASYCVAFCVLNS